MKYKYEMDDIKKEISRLEVRIKRGEDAVKRLEELSEVDDRKACLFGTAAFFGISLVTLLISIGSMFAADYFVAILGIVFSTTTLSASSMFFSNYKSQVVEKACLKRDIEVKESEIKSDERLLELYEEKLELLESNKNRASVVTKFRNTRMYIDSQIEEETMEYSRRLTNRL